jgi:hypothetical protein
MVLLSFFIGNDFLETTKVNSLHRYSYLASLTKYLYDVSTKMGNFEFTTTTLASLPALPMSSSNE